MKVPGYLGSLLCVLLCLSGCQKDNEINTAAIRAVAPVITPPVNSNWQLTQPAGDENTFLFRLGWSKSRFLSIGGDYVPVDSVTYEVEADLSANNFSKAKVLASTAKLYTDIYTLQLNELVHSLLGKESNEVQNLSLRVKIKTAVADSVYSEPVTLVVRPYIYVEPPVVPDAPKFIYIIGDMNQWNPNNHDFIMFRDNNDGADGKYTYTGNFGTGVYLKFCAEEFLGGFANMYCAADGGKLEFGDTGAFYIAGYKTVTIDIINMTWKIEPYDAGNAKNYDIVGPIGGFCNWDNEPAMTPSAFDKHQWRINQAFTGSTACKFRGDRNWTNNWGGGELDIPFGKAVFDGPGATVQEAGTYTIYFNDLTGHYVIKKDN